MYWICAVCGHKNKVEDSICSKCNQPGSLAELTEFFVTEEPCGHCDVCHRATWNEDMLGKTCFMPQPSGLTCLGVFQ